MTIETGVIIAIIIGLVSIAKKLGLESKFAPVLALILGVGINLVVKYLGAETGELVVGGIIAGLTSMGLYSGTKATFKK